MQTGSGLRLRTGWWVGSTGPNLATVFLRLPIADAVVMALSTEGGARHSEQPQGIVC